MSKRTQKEKDDKREEVKFDPYWTKHSGENLTKAEYVAKCFRENEGFHKGARVSRR